MKKYLSAALIEALVTGFVSSGALKATADVIERGFVSVSITANTELPPDVVEINIAVYARMTNLFKNQWKKTNKFLTEYINNSLILLTKI